MSEELDEALPKSPVEIARGTVADPFLFRDRHQTMVRFDEIVSHSRPFSLHEVRQLVFFFLCTVDRYDSKNQQLVGEDFFAGIGFEICKKTTSNLVARNQ